MGNVSTERTSRGGQQKSTGPEPEPEPEPGEELLCCFFWGKTGWPLQWERAAPDNVNNMILDMKLRLGGDHSRYFYHERN